VCGVCCGEENINADVYVIYEDAMYCGSYWEGRGKRILETGVLNRSGSRADRWYGARVLLGDREICLSGATLCRRAAARLLASGAGVASAFETIKPPELLYFEPHQPELCGFQPNTFVDITGVFERKLKAMEAMAAQKYMHKHYAERAEHRAFHARYATGDGEVRYAEAFQRAIPQVVRSL
jgi:hypothetical protein